MRPPASERLTVGSVPATDVTSGISLKGLGDWRNLTTDESIQIAHLEDLSLAEASLYHVDGHANSLKFVETIVSPSRDFATPGDVNVNVIAKQLEDAYLTKTLVSVDKLATRSGHLLDSRLIFSPCPKGALRDNRTSREAGTSSLKVSESPRTSQHRKLWHSDSELFVPLGEGVVVESTSVDEIYRKRFRLQKKRSEAFAEELSLVKPLETITYSSKLGEIKPVPLLSDFTVAEIETETVKSETESETDAMPAKSSAKVTKVYKTLSKSFRKKRKTLSNIGRLNELFKAKDTKPEVSGTSKSRVDTSCRVPAVPKLTSTESLKFESDTLADISKTAEAKSSTFEQPTTDHMDYLQTGSGTRRIPCLGVRRKEAVTIDKLDMDLVCDLKRSLATNNNKKAQIKTNGSLKITPNTTHSATTEKIWSRSPRRVGNRRFGTASSRTNRTCFVSTV